MRVDRSPEGSEGRIAALWLQHVTPGGIFVLSCYLHDGEQGSARNLELLSKALQDAHSCGCPWLIGIDGQQPPAELLKWAAPVIDRAGATIADPAEPTHFPGVGCSRCLEYFIVCRELADAVIKIDIISELQYVSGDNHVTVPARPHRVVQLTLRSKFRPPLRTVLKRPKSFPRIKPIGCARQPVEMAGCAPVGRILDEHDRDAAAGLVSDR
jgi:hypothetical protein